jgi:hypothetical protein
VGKSRSFPIRVGYCPTELNSSGREASALVKYELYPTPPNTPTNPSYRAESYPACSSAAHAVSRKTRCCGSIISASRGVKPKNSASKCSASSRAKTSLT